MSILSTLSAYISPFLSLTPYHILTYSTLLGTELYQSFIMTKVCYRALPMSAFTTLQKKVFPIYFNTQSLLLVVTALTVPPYGPLSLVTDWRDLIPLGFAGFVAGLNWAVYGPRTQKAMVDRIHQETRDGTKYNDPNISEEMRLLNRAFSRQHAMAIHLNLLAILATVWYGFRLVSRFSLEAKKLHDN
ncbi:hypothetical protein GQ43DRAFT_440799 [Delitschia confertaspora ATCC 74209]|uniref:TMEM205-like domain-containing protein n=1 Tax=Delitschia confertaspora ATCC 74209 TaxID=1513339 RepID=A0A9P4JLB1_9PLEO|nr:hypothetical protein GQ43DRAFT_440799 [Delitschia confertaspora ATCC 74209]